MPYKYRMEFLAPVVRANKEQYPPFEDMLKQSNYLHQNYEPIGSTAYTVAAAVSMVASGMETSDAYALIVERTIMSNDHIDHLDRVAVTFAVDGAMGGWGDGIAHFRKIVMSEEQSQNMAVVLGGSISVVISESEKVFPGTVAFIYDRVRQIAMRPEVLGQVGSAILEKESNHVLSYIASLFTTSFFRVSEGDMPVEQWRELYLVPFEYFEWKGGSEGAEFIAQLPKLGIQVDGVDTSGFMSLSDASTRFMEGLLGKTGF